MPRLQSHKAPEGKRLLARVRRLSKEEIAALVDGTPTKELVRQLFLMLKESEPHGGGAGSRKSN